MEERQVARRVFQSSNSQWGRDKNIQVMVQSMNSWNLMAWQHTGDKKNSGHQRQFRFLIGIKICLSELMPHPSCPQNVICSIIPCMRYWTGPYLNQIRDFPGFWSQDLHCVDSNKVQPYDVLQAQKGLFDQKHLCQWPCPSLQFSTSLRLFGLRFTKN